MLQAKVDGKWGALPETIKPNLPAEGTLVTFEVIKSFIEPSTGKKSWVAQEELRPIIKIKNPDPKGAPIEIGIINGLDHHGQPVPDGIRRIKIFPKAQHGLVALSVGSGVDSDELIKFLMLTSENESSKFRDAGIEPLIRFKDYKAEATKKIEALKVEQEAMGLIFAAKGAELRELAHLNNIYGLTEDWDIRSQLSDKAKKDPATFLALANDEDKDTKATLAAGIGAGAVTISEDHSAIVNTANNSIILPLNNTSDYLNEFAAHIRTDGKGAMMLKAIKTLTDQKNKNK